MNIKLLTWLLSVLLISISVLFYMFVNRLEKIDEVRFGNYHFEVYQDWAESTGYFKHGDDRVVQKNCYVIQRNGYVYFRFEYSEKGEGFRGPLFSIEDDSLVLGQGYEQIYYRIPVSLPNVSMKNIRVYKIDKGWFKDGTKVTSDSHFDYKTTLFKDVVIDTMPNKFCSQDHLIKEY